MKIIAALLFLISSTALFSQSEAVFGDYLLKLGNTENHLIEYKLTLDQEGTFLFHSYTNIKNAVPAEVNKYGKGKWTATANVVTFFSNKEKDFDEKYTLDFNNTKARFMSKHPRDKTDRIIKTRLHFLESDIFWIKGLDVFKI